MSLKPFALESGLEQRADWGAAAAREPGHRLPITLVAANGTGDVVGGVGVAEHDLTGVLPRVGPWIVGMVRLDR